MSYGTSSMKNHLERKHSIVWKKAVSLPNKRINEYVETRVKFCSNESSVKVTKLLSLALAETTAPYRLVENYSFREAIKLLNEGYTVPSHQTISHNFGDLSETIIAKIKKS